MAEKRKMDQMQAYIIMTVNGNIYFGQVSKKQQSFVQKKNKQKNNQNIKEKCRRLYVVCGKFVVNMW